MDVAITLVASAAGLIDRAPPVGRYGTFVSYSTVGATATATFGGPNAAAACGALINAGSSVPVPLYFTGGGAFTPGNSCHLSGSVAALSAILILTFCRA